MALGSAATALWARQALGQTLLFEKRYDAMVSEGRAFLAEHPSGEDAELTQRFVCAARALGHIAGPDPAPAPAARRPQGKVEAPRPIFRQPPGYTETALAAAVRGAVVAEAIVDQEGCVADARIVTGLAGDLDLAVLDALRFWTFHPATLEGKPVKVRYTLTANFAAPDPANATLRGTVEGRLFGALPGVEIELRSPELREPRVVVSNAHGEFSLADLPPGRYTVTLHLEGFVTASREVDLEGGRTAALDLRMEPMGVVACGLAPP